MKLVSIQFSHTILINKYVSTKRCATNNHLLNHDLPLHHFNQLGFASVFFVQTLSMVHATSARWVFELWPNSSGHIELWCSCGKSSRWFPITFCPHSSVLLIKKCPKVSGVWKQWGFDARHMQTVWIWTNGVCVKPLTICFWSLNVNHIWFGSAWSVSFLSLFSTSFWV